jgi:RND family efflux transporter MFP subunit
VIVPAVVLLVAAVGCGEKEKTTAFKTIRPVKALTINFSGDVDIISLPGKTRASRRLDLSFKVPGRLVDLSVAEGQAVTKGQCIARLSDRDFKTQLDQARALAMEAERNYTRYKELVGRDQVSKTEFDRYKAIRDVSRAQLEDAENALDDSFLKAPFSGIVAKKYVDNHQEVQAKQPIVFLQNIEAIDILVDVPETLMALCRDKWDFNAVATFAVAPGQAFPLSLKEYSTEAETDTQTYRVVFSIPQPQGLRILPGMTATVECRLSFSSQTGPRIIIPAISVTRDSEKKPYVWIIHEPEMTVSKRMVRMGELTGDRGVLILDGLKTGEKVVTAGVTKLESGMKVRLWNPSK